VVFVEAMNNTTHISKAVIKTTTALDGAQRKILLGIETPLDRAIRLFELGNESGAFAALVTDRQRRRLRHHVAKQKADERRKK
jgi:hypothetical protein